MSALPSDVMPRAARRTLLPRLVLAEWAHHPWRQAAAVAAVALGVALAFAVALINGSALAEFGQAVRAAGGTPDTVLRAAASSFDESLYPRVAALAPVALASPAVEVETAWRDAGGRAHPVTLLGLDALVAPAVSPGWAPLPASSAITTADPRFAALDPGAVFANAAARAALGTADTITLRTPGGWRTFRLAGAIAADGPPLLVLDIAGAQDAFGRGGRLSRLDLRLRPGASVDTLRLAMAADPALATALSPSPPDAPAERMERLTRAYRVNLGVLALVALFTGGFLVFSVQSLAVAKRVPQLALLGVLGLEAAGRRVLVLVDGALVGVIGSAIGLALGAGLAAAALQALGGDLGSGLLGGAAPPLALDPWSALAYAALGTGSALAGSAWPARAAERLAPAQSLKGLAMAAGRPWPAAWALATMAAGGVLATLPPIFDLPWAAYGGVGLLLLGGIGLVPSAVALALSRLRRIDSPVWTLAVARALDQRHTATAAVAGVVASLSLVVALTVMVASFRDSLSDWLGEVLPADLYVRPKAEGDREDVFLQAAVLDAVKASPAVRAWRLQRIEPVSLSAESARVVLLARDEQDPSARVPVLPWRDAPGPEAGAPADPATRRVDVYPSEVLAALRHLRVGDAIEVPLPEPAAPAHGVVRGVWRDYARQQGALLMMRADWLRLTGDARASDLALWWRADAAPAARRAATDAIVASAPPNAPIEAWTPARLRAVSMDIFDRSFAVTRWLQGVALAIGLAGIAASFSAQVLARRREFGTLQHLGFTRRQVLSLVTVEGALWTAVGVALGVALGLLVSVVLVDVVNPQSFHWTMRWRVPVDRLLELTVVAVAAGTFTAWAAGRGAASRDMARAVKEDW